MFDFLQNLTKSAEEKRQETIAAYVDGALNGRSRQQFEQEMAQDEALRQEVAQLQLIKQSLRQLPQREVPRNFILDPAEFAQRPAPQPWVQAYPVLRTATALAAFFFIFALAAGIFTGFGLGGGEAASAPAADVAQVEETTEETLAFEAETTSEAEDAGAADTALDAEADLFEEEEEMEEAMSDDAVADEALEEEAMEEAEEPASAEEAAPAEPAATNALPGNTAEDEAMPAATAVLSPTPTVSNLPRVTSPTPLPERDMEIADGTGDAANDAIADEPVDNIPEPAVDEDTEAAETTAVLPDEAVETDNLTEPASPLLWLQIGLGAVLLLLLGLTFYARRQR